MISTEVMFGTISSITDLNLTFTHAQISAPETHTEYAEVPGRSPVDLSELIVGKPYYNLRELVLEFEYVGSAWASERQTVYGKLHGQKMDIRLLTDPQWYYTGRCSVESEVNASTLHFIVTVTAEPFKHLYNETPVTLSGAGTITNPTLFDSLPLIKVNGSGAGTVTIGNNTITLLDIDGYVYIDSDLMDCYKGQVNCNADVTLTEFPTLAPGATGVSFTGGVTSVVIEGRWRTL